MRSHVCSSWGDHRMHTTLPHMYMWHQCGCSGLLENLVKDTLTVGFRACLLFLSWCGHPHVGVESIRSGHAFAMAWDIQRYVCHSRSRVQASLLNAYRHQLCYESMLLDDKCAIVTPKSLCQVCHKRLGTQQALITPELKIVHSKCFTK